MCLGALPCSRVLLWSCRIPGLHNLVVGMVWVALKEGVELWVFHIAYGE